MTTEKNLNGTLIIRDIIGGHLVQRVFFGYSRRDATKMFREETRQTTNQASRKPAGRKMETP